MFATLLTRQQASSKSCPSILTIRLYLITVSANCASPFSSHSPFSFSPPLTNPPINRLSLLSLLLNDARQTLDQGSREESTRARVYVCRNDASGLQQRIHPRVPCVLLNYSSVTRWIYRRISTRRYKLIPTTPISSGERIQLARHAGLNTPVRVCTSATGLNSCY